MSWNKYCIVVNPVNENNLDEIIRSIGYHILEPGKEVDFKTAFDHRGAGMPFGLIDNSLWILSADQVAKFFLEQPSALEKNLTKKFPTSTILALEENSTVDSFGFSLIQNGERVRVLSGCDQEYYYEYGHEINEEKDCYQEVLRDFDEESKLEIISQDGTDGLQKHLLFEAKWRVPFTLFQNIYGKNIETVYEENKKFRYYHPRQ